MGLVNRVASKGDLSAYVRSYAETIAAKAPLTVKAVKRITCELAKEPGMRVLAPCDALIAECYGSEDHREGRRAFMENRKPVFKVGEWGMPHPLLAQSGHTRVRMLPHRRKAAIDRDRGAGDEVGGGRSEEDGDAGEVFGDAPAAGRSAGQHPLVQSGDLLAGVAGQLGVDPAGQDGVDLDVVRRPGGRQRLGQLDEGAFAR